MTTVTGPDLGPHDQPVRRGLPILAEPWDGPFGRTFVLRDLDGYAITIHDAA